VFEGNLQIIMNYNIFLSMTIIEDPTASVKSRTAIRALFLFLNLCLSVMLDSLSFSFSLHLHPYNFLLNRVFHIFYICNHDQNDDLLIVLNTNSMCLNLNHRVNY